MSEAQVAAEAFAERLISSDSVREQYWVDSARAVAAAVYLLADRHEDEARALLRTAGEPLVARMCKSKLPSIALVGLQLQVKSERERASILAMLATVASL